MNESLSKFVDKVRHSTRMWVPAAIGVLVIAIAIVSSDSWSPRFRTWLFGDAEKKAEEVKKQSSPTDSIHVSEQAKRNIGLTVGDVEVRKEYARKLSVPGMVVGLPGRTRFQIASPMTGVVTDIAVVRGQSIWSDELLFRLRLSHEDLVRAQTNFLRTLGELDAEKKEITRLEKITGGGVAARLVLERQYTRDKLEAVMRAQEEALHLHGLSDPQITFIREKRKLVRELVVKVPQLHGDSSLHFDREMEPHQNTAGSKSRIVKTGSKATQEHSRRHRFVVEQLPVHIGQAVKTGDTLCVLADYQNLSIEGWAFEQDADELVAAANKNRIVTAIPEGKGRIRKEIPDLGIVYVDNEIDAKSRALRFYVGLRNETIPATNTGNERYLTWKYRPGQRMQLRVPVEIFKNVIVLPVDAVAQEGPEFYVFVEDGKAFKKTPVAVKYRDQFEAVLDYDGAIYPGNRVALNGAHQLLMAIKNKAGGGVDPHAGHHH